MITSLQIEKLIQAHVDGNDREFVEIVENVIDRAKQQKKNLVAKRLKSIVSKVHLSKQFSTQSAINKTILPQEIDGNLYIKSYPTRSFQDIVLEGHVQVLIKQLISEWEQVSNLNQHDLNPTNKILIYGKPGTGKSVLANAIAYALDMPLVIVQLDELISSYLGKTGKNIREIFDLAATQRVVIFLDEIDTIAKHRDDAKELGELKRVVTVLLQNIDNFPSHSVLIGATNHESLLDSALWRRFDLKLLLDLPDLELRKQIFAKYLSSFPNEVDLNLVAKITEGLSGSQIEDVCNKTKRSVILEKKIAITTTDILKTTVIVAFFSRKYSSEVRKNIYLLSQELKNNGYSLNDIADLTGIPYTTLRDNIK